MTRLIYSFIYIPFGGCTVALFCFIYLIVVVWYSCIFNMSFKFAVVILVHEFSMGFCDFTFGSGSWNMRNIVSYVRNWKHERYYAYTLRRCSADMLSFHSTSRKTDERYRPSLQYRLGVSFNKFSKLIY